MKKIGKVVITGIFSIMMIMAFIPTQNESVEAGIGDTIADTFPDPVMASQMASILGKTVTDTIDANDVAITNTIFLGGNITNISGIETFTNLTYLSVAGTQITTIPDSIDELVNLLDLDLQHNQITTLPSSIANLSQLESLDLSYNAFLAMPSIIGNLSTLEYLNLAGNQLSTIPSSLANLTNLTDFYFLENQIIDLPIIIYNHSAPGKLFGDQKYESVLANGIIQENYVFDALPVYEQVPTYGDGSEFIYSLVLPDGSEVVLTPVISSGKITIDKSLLTLAGEYTFKATIFTGHLDPSEYIQLFTLTEAAPTPPVSGGAGDNSSVPTGQRETISTYLILLIGSLGAFRILKIKRQLYMK